MSSKLVADQLKNPEHPLNNPPWNGEKGSLAFLGMFKAHLFGYIPDSESLNLGIVHTFGVDGLTPSTIALPNPKKQEQGYGMFFTVNGFKNAKARTKENLYSINGNYLDIDWPHDRTPTPQELLEFKSAVLEDLMAAVTAEQGLEPEVRQEPPAPTAIVETKNGYHVYWVYENPIILDRLDVSKAKKLFEIYAEIQVAIINRYQGDPAAKDLTRFLRVPGSLHLKNPNSPFQTKLIHFDPESLVRFKEMRVFWLTNPHAKEAANSYSKATEAFLDSTRTPFSKKVESTLSSLFQNANTKPELTEDEWKEVSKRYPKDQRPSTKALMSPTGIIQGRRNKCLLLGVSALREAGWTEQSVLDSINAQGGYNGLSDYEIKQTVHSAFRSPTAYSYGWNDPILAEYVTLEEQSKVVKTIRTIREEHEDKQDGQLEAPTGTIAEFSAPKGYLDLPKEIKKEIFDHFEIHFFKRHPELVYATDIGFFRREDDGSWFSPITDGEISRLVNRELYSLGLADRRGTGQIAAKVDALQAFVPMSVSREAAENALRSKPGNGTFLNLKSGILDVDTGRVGDRRNDLFFSHAIDADPTLNTPFEVFPKFLDDICSRNNAPKEEKESKKLLLQEIAGYCLTPYNHLQKAFIFYGGGENGKSTFLNLFSKLLGPENVSSLSFTEITRQFGIYGLYRKRLNIVEEISNNYFESDTLKKVITGEEIVADRKYKEQFAFHPTVKIILSVNQFPKVNDTSHALYRRFIVIPFDRTFTAEDKDPLMSDKLWAERDGILKWAIEGWQRLLKNGKFTQSEVTDAALDEFREGNSPVVEFLLGKCDIRKESVNTADRMEASRWLTSGEELYRLYKLFTGENGYKAKSFKSFVSECATLTHRRLAGVKVTRLYSVISIEGLRPKTSTLLSKIT